MNARQLSRLFAAPALVVACVGCMTPSATLSAKAPPVPLSMTAAVHGPDGRVLREGAGYKVIRKCEATSTRMMLLFGCLTLPDDIDVGELFAKDVAIERADAIVEINANGREHLSGPLTWPAELIPIWPFFWDYEVRGKLVKFDAPAPAPAADPAPAPAPAADPAPASVDPASAPAPAVDPAAAPVDPAPAAPAAPAEPAPATP